MISFTRCSIDATANVPPLHRQPTVDLDDLARGYRHRPRQTCPADSSGRLGNAPGCGQIASAFCLVTCELYHWPSHPGQRWAVDVRRYVRGGIDRTAGEGYHCEQLGVEEDEVSPEASFIDDLGADSLDTVELVMALKRNLISRSPMRIAEGISTVQDAIDYIKANVKEV